jgi:TonB-dependent receptor
MDYKAKFVVITHSVYGDAIVPDTLNTVDRNDDNYFPNAHLRYKFTDWADIRLAYTESISRPDYKAILPNVAYEDGGYAQAGNTKLKPRLSTNYDVFLSFYNNEIGLFSIGGFYKKIKDTFYATRVYYQNIDAFNITFPGEEVWDSLGYESPEAALRINSYVNNPHPAYVRGLELDWQTQFWYLPKPFNALVLNINYTRAWSDMDYQQIRNYTVTMPPDSTHRRPWPLPVSVDTVRNARLLYQGDHNLNIALGIDYKGFSGRISFNMQGDVITSVGTRPEEDQFTGTFYKWDFTLQQKLPIEGLSVALNGINVFHNPVKNYQKFKRTIDGKVKKNLSSIAYSPRIFQFNVRYSF